ncbi:hypothetical protein SK128_003832, partial [Halocaridina rubra]
PLHPSHPSSGETVLALGSSRVVIFEGGPLPWISKPSSHYVQVDVDDSEKLRISKIEAPEKYTDIHAVNVVCQDIGEYYVTITVGNAPSATLPHPRNVSSKVKVICALPDAISLTVPTKSSCPGVAKIGMTVTHCSKPLLMKIDVMDYENRKFDNISSLSLLWSVSNETLATIPSEPSSLIQVSSLYGFSIPIHSKCHFVAYVYCIFHIVCD